MFKGETIKDRWVFNYSVGLAGGKSQDLQRRIEFTTRGFNNSHVPNFDPKGNPIIKFTEGKFAEPVLTDAGWAFARNADNYFFHRQREREYYDDNKRIHGTFDTTYEPDSDIIRYIKFGLKAERSSRRSEFVEFSDYRDNKSVSAINFSDAAHGWLGKNRDFSQMGNPYSKMTNVLGFNRDALFNMTSLAKKISLMKGTDGKYLIYNQNLEDRSDPNSAPKFDIDEDNNYQVETVLAGYVMGRADFDKWEVIGGARIEHTQIHVVNASKVRVEYDGVENNSTEEPKEFDTGYTTILPRFQVNYRQSDNLIFRGAFFTSLARVEPSRLHGFSADYDDVEKVLTISAGNPSLKPAYAYNFDLGAEYYFEDRIGMVSFNLFYKHINKFIFDGMGMSSDETFVQGIDLTKIPGLKQALADGATLRVNQDANGEAASVYGMEASLQYELDEDAGIFDGFGLFTNLVLQKSKATISLGENAARTSRFFNAPKYAGTVSVTYNKHNLDLSLTYSFQGHQIDEPEEFYLDEHEQAYNALDLNFKYHLPTDGEQSYSFFISVTDILDGGQKPINWETRTSQRRWTDDIEFDGRTVKFGFTATF